MGGQTPSH